MQITIRMPDEYKARIDEVVLKTGLKKSDIARLAIKNFLKNFGGVVNRRPSKILPSVITGRYFLNTTMNVM